MALECALLVDTLRRIADGQLCLPLQSRRPAETDVRTEAWAERRSD